MGIMLHLFRHYLHDPYAVIRGWTKVNPGKWNVIRQQIDRVPGIYTYGAGLFQFTRGIAQ